MPRLELRNQFVFSQFRKFPSGNSSHPVTFSGFRVIFRNIKRIGLNNFYLQQLLVGQDIIPNLEIRHLLQNETIPMIQNGDFRSKMRKDNNETLPCIEIIGQSPVLYTHLHTVFVWLIICICICWIVYRGCKGCFCMFS